VLKTTNQSKLDNDIDNILLGHVVWMR